MIFDKNGYMLSADHLKNLKIRANNRTDTAAAALTTKYASVFIYEIDPNTIGLKVDTDSNGTCETTLKTVSILENTSVLSVNAIQKGSTVKVTASAAGGTGDYTYSVSYKLSSSEKWVTAQNYSTNQTITIKPGAAVTYSICIKVRDSSGTVAKKTFTVKVTK